MKPCFKCHETKPLSEFYRHRMMNDGYLGKCKGCTRADSISNRNRRIDYYRKYDIDRAKTPKGLKRIISNTKKWRAANPDKNRAHRLVGLALRRGSLQKKPCEVCGHEKSHAHHDDYSKPLDVVWLCPKHHCERHKMLREMQRRAS